MRKKVVCVFGDFEEDDFVLEPSCSDDCNCEICKDAFWIKRIRHNKFSDFIKYFAVFSGISFWLSVLTIFIPSNIMGFFGLIGIYMGMFVFPYLFILVVITSICLLFANIIKKMSKNSHVEKNGEVLRNTTRNKVNVCSRHDTSQDYDKTKQGRKAN